jgi:hypothetical protein
MRENKRREERDKKKKGRRKRERRRQRRGVQKKKSYQIYPFQKYIKKFSPPFLWSKFTLHYYW